MFRTVGCEPTELVRLAPHCSEHITAHTVPFINPVLRLPSFCMNSWPLKMVPIGCPETSVRNYHYSLRNTPEECSSHLLRGGCLKSRFVVYIVPLFMFSTCVGNVTNRIRWWKQWKVKWMFCCGVQLCLTDVHQLTDITSPSSSSWTLWCVGCKSCAVQLIHFQLILLCPSSSWATCIPFSL